MATRVPGSGVYRTTVVLSHIHISAIEKAKEELAKLKGVPKDSIKESEAVQYLITQGARVKGWIQET